MEGKRNIRVLLLALPGAADDPLRSGIPKGWTLGSVTIFRDDKPLTAASRALRQREREQKADANRAAEAKPASMSGVEVVATMQQSRDRRMKLLEQIQQQVIRIVEHSTMADLRLLAGALSLNERRIARREQRHSPFRETAP